MSKKVILITGVTAGIGAATARKFASDKNALIIGTGRRNDRLAALSEEIKKIGCDFISLNFDVRSASECAAALESLPDEVKAIDLLVNNAGLSRGLAPIDQGALEDWEEMIDANIKGVLYISRIVSGWMRARKAGHIINVGSTAGKEVYPNGNVYCATKHAVDALTKGMRMDLITDGVKVSVVHPGFVETEFSLVRFRGDEARARQTYAGFEPLAPEQVADVIYWMANAPANVNIADVLLLPAAQASAMVVDRSRIKV